VIAATAAQLVVAAADTASSFDPISLVTSTVTPGIVILLLVTGKLRTQSEVNRLEEEGARKDEIVEAQRQTIAAQHQALVDKVVPALTLATAALGKRATQSRE
jgi:hypothetical protein